MTKGHELPFKLPEKAKKAVQEVTESLAAARKVLHSLI